MAGMHRYTVYRLIMSAIKSKYLCIFLSLAPVCIFILSHLNMADEKLQNASGFTMKSRKQWSIVASTPSFSSIKMSNPEVTHVAFLKVHKTGSTTAQNIFLRFGATRNLTFILGSIKDNECGGWPNCISYYDTLTDKNIWPPPVNKSFDILCNHVIYNRKSFQKYLPPDTVNIGIVREPVSRLASAINFFKLLKNTQLSTYANDPARFNHDMLNNRMAFEFGFDKKLFPETSNRTLTDTEKREAFNYLDQLNNDFSLIIILEKYDESLVLMKRILKWSTKDILYRTRGQIKHTKFDGKDEIKLKSYLYLDFMLYDFALKQLENKISTAGNSFINEVEAFSKLNINVNNYCDKKWSRPMTIQETAWHGEFIVDQNDCFLMRKQEIRFIHEIRQTQYQ